MNGGPQSPVEIQVERGRGESIKDRTVTTTPETDQRNGV